MAYLFALLHHYKKILGFMSWLGPFLFEVFSFYMQRRFHLELWFHHIAQITQPIILNKGMEN